MRRSILKALRPYRWHRSFATVAPEDPTKIRNIALLAHIDSGKTTLTESILHSSSYVTNPGTVDTGSTTTDFLPAERERGITIQSASIPVKWKDWTFNLIDTPGHADFGMEVESASRVIDGAIVLMDAVEGVEGQTLGVWKQLDRHDVPTRMIFLNKLDRPGASLRASIRSILANRLHNNPLLLTLPVASFDPAQYNSGEPGITGIIDLVNWEVWKWDENGSSSQHALPRTPDTIAAANIFPASHPLIKELLPAREALVDAICLLESDFLSKFLALSSPSPYLEISSKDILTALRRLTFERSVLPILCGAALRHIGTDLTLNFVGEILANPVDAQPKAIVPSKPGEVQMLAWKVSWDKQKGWMTFVRIYSGTLTRQTILYNTASRQRERISKLVLLYASRPETVESLPYGSVGVILGLKHTRTGDTLVSTVWSDKARASSVASDTSLRNITPPPSVVSASVIPHSQSDVQPVKDALAALSRTDPSLRVTEDEEEGQTLVHGLGALHLEIVEGRLADEWGVRCQFGKRRVSYRETLSSSLAESGEPIVIEERWEKEMGGKRVGGTIRLALRGLTEPEHEQSAAEDWDGNLIVDVNGKLYPSSDVGPGPDVTDPSSPIGPMLQGIMDALSTSPHTSLPISNVYVQIQHIALDDGSPPVIMAGAATSALRQAIQRAGRGDVMEPYVRVKVDVAEEVIGKVVNDLTEHGGEIHDLGSVSGADDAGESLGFPEDGVYIPPAWLSPSSASSLSESNSHSAKVKRSVHGVAPLSQMLDYSGRLRALSGGLGVFEMSVEGFRTVGELRKIEILREIGRA